MIPFNEKALVCIQIRVLFLF